MERNNQQQFQPAPWTLRGDAVFALKLVRKELVQPLVPPDARVICVWPGRTVAMLYLCEYRHSPVGEYREVILAPAIVRLQGKLGAWISHIAVDSELSVIAGRSIWALPKQRASLQWPPVGIAAPRRALRLPFVGAALALRDGVVNRFVVRGAARVGATRARIDSMRGVDLQPLGWSGLQRMYVCADMEITIGPSSVRSLV